MSGGCNSSFSGQKVCQDPTTTSFNVCVCVKLQTYAFLLSLSLRLAVPSLSEYFMTHHSCSHLVVQVVSFFHLDLIN